MANKASVSRVVAVLILGLLANGSPRADELPLVTDVEFQPLVAQVRRVAQALDLLGRPLSAEEKDRIDQAVSAGDEREGLKVIQQVLGAACLVGVEINPESRVKATQGPAAPELHQGGWSVFLVKVHNEAGVTADLAARSPNALPVFKQYREKDGLFYFKLTDAKGAVLLQSQGFAAPREAAQAMARLQAEGKIALDALASHLIAPDDVERVTSALQLLRESAA